MGDPNALQLQGPNEEVGLRVSGFDWVDFCSRGKSPQVASASFRDFDEMDGSAKRHLPDTGKTCEPAVTEMFS